MSMIDMRAALPEWAHELTTQGILITDAELTICGWNRWMERHSGRVSAETLGRDLLKVYPELSERHLDYVYRQALDGAVIVLSQRLHAYLLPMRPRSDLSAFAHMQQSARVGPLLEGGQVVGTVTVIDDVTERVASEQDLRRLLAQEQAARAAAEVARGRLSFLAEASALLAGSLDYEDTLVQVAHLMLPALADYCLIDLVTPGRAAQRVALAHADPAKDALLHELEQRYPRNEASRPGLVAIQTGKPQIIGDIARSLSLDRAHDDEHRRLLATLATRAVLAVPLTARGQILGAITLGSAQPDRYRDEDLALVGDVAQRAAMAIDNARLYQQAQMALQARDHALTFVETERAKLQRLFTQAPAAICILEGPEHHFAFANPLYRQIVGQPDLIGRPIREVLPDLEGQGLFELLDRIYATGEPFVDTEIPVRIGRRGDGNSSDTHFLHCAYQPTRDAHGHVDGILVHAVDVTAQVLAQRERASLLARAETARSEAEAAVRMRDLFFSVAAHELKTPLTSLHGNIELIQRRTLRDGALNERDQRAFAVVAAQSRRLRQMIEALLDVTRLEAGQLSLACAPLDLRALAQQVVAEVQPALVQHTIDYRGPAEPLIVSGDELRLEQVLQNLLQNAVKYSPGGGAVAVRVFQDAERACVSVADQGIGIPAEALARLFQRFYRAANVETMHISGMGIGLYVVREIVALHGGTVNVESVQGLGSTFTVCLPLLQS